MVTVTESSSSSVVRFGRKSVNPGYREILVGTSIDVSIGGSSDN